MCMRLNPYIVLCIFFALFSSWKLLESQAITCSPVINTGPVHSRNRISHYSFRNMVAACIGFPHSLLCRPAQWVKFVIDNFACYFSSILKLGEEKQEQCDEKGNCSFSLIGYVDFEGKDLLLPDSERWAHAGTPQRQRIGFLNIPHSRYYQEIIVSEKNVLIKVTEMVFALKYKWWTVV